MASPVDYYNTGADNYFRTRPTYNAGQSFTASKTYDISSIKFNHFKTSDPGTITARLWAVGVTGKPTGSALATATRDGNDIVSGGTWTDGEWFEYTFDTPYTVTSGVQYVVTLVPANDGAYTVLDFGSSSYSGGVYMQTVNSTTTWFIDAGSDFMFETYEVEGTFIDASISIETEVDVDVTADTIDIIEASIAVEADVDVSVTGTIKTVVVGSALTDNKRIVAVGNNELWYEDI